MRWMRSAGRVVVTLVAVALAGAAGWRLWAYYMEAPWTRDGRVRADVVAVATDVSGLVLTVDVHDNQEVKQGQLLFRIDPRRAVLALRQADAALAARTAARDEASQEYERYRTLSSISVSQEKQQQTEAVWRQAEAALEQARADRELAALNVARTQVAATVSGVVTNVGLRPGDYVTAGQGVMALVDRASLHVEGYFEETRLPRIHPGDPATVRLMGEPADIAGHVDSIAGGIVDRERSEAAGGLANVAPTFAWVRLAQRVPVRIALDRVPESVALVPGRTAAVWIGAAR